MRGELEAQGVWAVQEVMVLLEVAVATGEMVLIVHPAIGRVEPGEPELRRPMDRTVAMVEAGEREVTVVMVEHYLLRRPP